MAVNQLASVDGRIAATEQSSIGLPDDGLYRGDGVFEVIKLYAGRPFALGDHLDRIERSAGAIELGVDRDAVEAEIEPLLAAHGSADAQLRIILTRAGRRLMMIEPIPPHAPSISLMSVVYSPSRILDGVKSLSYAANMQAGRIAAAAGADEALFVQPDGTVLEAPTSSIFWATDHGKLRTPSLDLPILDSITRARIVAEIDVEQGTYALPDLERADEAFLASTTREVHAIAAIDGRELPAVDGPRTREAAEAFAAVVARELG